MKEHSSKDHGGGIDAACVRWGGVRADWLDLSTGINPDPYPIPDFAPEAFCELPDQNAFAALEEAARRHWAVPESADFLACSGASSAIAALPSLLPPGAVSIPGPTYNEHAAAFRHWGWRIDLETDDARVLVLPNNPDGRLWQATDVEALRLTVIDESFCDVAPQASLIDLAAEPRVMVLKSLGKFWGLAGLRVGFAIGDAALIAPLRARLGPWQVSGPGLELAACALADRDWAENTRARLSAKAARLDGLAERAGWQVVGGTSLFRLYETPNAADVQKHLAGHRILVRVFPYSDSWVRVGLPPEHAWNRVEAAF